MGKSRWNKQELEVMNDYYVNGVWEEIVELLPRKTEKQILNKADQLGLKKEDDLLAHYCDLKAGREVVEKRSFHKDMGVTKTIIRFGKVANFASKEEAEQVKRRRAEAQKAIEDFQYHVIDTMLKEERKLKQEGKSNE